MSECTPNRRWFRFSLRTLFVLVTLAACWLGYNLNWVRQRREFVAAEKQLRGSRNLAVATVLTRNRRVSTPFVLRALNEDGFSDVCVLASDVVEVDATVLKLNTFASINEHFRSRLTPSDMARVQIARRLFPEANVVAVHETRASSGRTEAHFVGCIPPD